MTASAHWIIAIAVAALVGTAGTLYFRVVVQRRDETTAGLSALAALSWREFIHLVLDALARRGYARVHNRDAAGDEDYTLERDGRRWLLSCKHGSAFVLGSAQVAELANEIRLANAAGGILATQGRIAAEARPSAALQHIELLDGASLWPELRDLVDARQLDAIVAGARRKARERTLLSWLLALVAGLGVFLLLPEAAPAPDAAPGAEPAATEVPAAPVAAPVAPSPLPAQATPAPVAAAAGEATLERQRQDVADAVSTLPMVDRAVWSSRSTLQVFLLETRTDPIPQICPLLLRHDALAPTRLQLTPPAGSSAPTRFRQCRSY